MGKAEEINDKIPAMSAQNEASKLLEQALMQMDGIISGNSSTIKSHSPDFTFPKTPSAGIRDAANALIQLLQNTSNPPSPDPHIAKALLDWLQQVNLFPEEFQLIISLLMKFFRIKASKLT